MIETILLVIYWSLFVIFSIQVSLLLIQSVLGTPNSGVQTNNDYSELCSDISSCILIPAHNEEDVIEDTILSLLNEITATDEILVVADNCGDKTTEILEKLDVKFIERTDETNRGKGYALAFGVNFILSNLPDVDVLIIVDADCDCSKLNVSNLKTSCHHLRSPIQCLNIMTNSENPSVQSKIAEFAWLYKGWIRQSANSILSMPAQLQGTGMAFPKRIFTTFNFDTGSIVEDLEYGLTLTAQGTKPSFTQLSKVVSTFPTDTVTTNAQRSRWEHGHLNVIFNQLPQFFLTAIMTRNYKLLWQVIDASIPPISLLTFSLIILVLISLLLMIIDLSYITLAMTLCFMFAISIMIGWYKVGRDILTLRDIIHVPIFIIKKISIYFNYIFNKQLSWNKTKRDK